MLHPYYTNDLIEAGCDEAGRGCLAGPVYAAAVILPRDFYDNELDDPYVDMLSPHKEEDNLDFDGIKVPSHKFHNFDFSSLSDMLGDHVMGAMKLDPLETIKRLDPQVRVIVIRKIHA